MSALVTLGLLTQIASADQLDAPKYKCLVSLEFIKAVSRYVLNSFIQNNVVKSKEIDIYK